MTKLNGRALATAALGMAAVLSSAAGFAQTSSPADTDTEIRSALAAKADPARGEAAFEDCVVCHRKEGAGRANGSVPRLAGQHAPVIIKQIVDVRSGRRVNERMKTVIDAAPLNTQSIADIAGYLEQLPRATSPAESRGKDLARGKALYEKDCARCHGAGGEGQAAKFYPMVATQHYAYLLRELNLIRDGGRGNSDPQMVEVIKPYSPDDLKAVANYMAQLPPPKR